jgi:putative hydrolase of the HAD superfamily
VRTIMLDVDGVLVNGRPQDGAHLFTDLEDDLGVSLDLLRQEFFGPRWPAIVTGQKPLIPELTEVLAVIAPAVTAHELVDYWFLNDSRIDKEVLDAISQLRENGDRVYLATNQEHMRASYLMKEMRLEDYVDGIFYSASIGHRKPDAEFYAAVSNSIAEPLESVTLVDDTEANVVAALAFGWNAIHWKSGMKITEILASSPT